MWTQKDSTIRVVQLVLILLGSTEILEVTWQGCWISLTWIARLDLIDLTPTTCDWISQQTFLNSFTECPMYYNYWIILYCRHNLQTLFSQERCSNQSGRIAATFKCNGASFINFHHFLHTRPACSHRLVMSKWKSIKKHYLDLTGTCIPVLVSCWNLMTSSPQEKEFGSICWRWGFSWCFSQTRFVMMMMLQTTMAKSRESVCIRPAYDGWRRKNLCTAIKHVST